MPLNVIVSRQKMLKRSHSCRLHSRMKYFSNSLQTKSTLKKEPWWGKGIEWRDSNSYQSPQRCNPWILPERPVLYPIRTGLDVHPCCVFVWCWEDFPLVNVQVSQASRLFWILKWEVNEIMRSKCQGHIKQWKVEELFQMKVTKKRWKLYVLFSLELDHGSENGR